MTNNILEVQAEDKAEARRKIFAIVRKLQTKVQFKTGFETKEGDNATFYINRITQKK
jgi:hypothetical protein